VSAVVLRGIRGLPDPIAVHESPTQHPIGIPCCGSGERDRNAGSGQRRAIEKRCGGVGHFDIRHIAAPAHESWEKSMNAVSRSAYQSDCRRSIFVVNALAVRDINRLAAPVACVGTNP